MGAIVFLAILLALVVIGFGVALLDSKKTTRTAAAGTASVLLAITVISYVGFSYERVPARNLGIVSSQGHVEAEILQPGGHMLAPWKSVDNLDTTNQPLKMVGEKGSNGKDENWIPWVAVGLGNKTVAHVDVTVLWHINNDEKTAVALYNANKNNKGGVFDRVRDNIVETQVKHAMTIVFGTYDPFAGLNTAAGSGTAPLVTMDDLEKQVLAYLAKEPTLSGITIVSLVINNFWPDQTTQDLLNKYAQTLAAKRIAEEQKNVNQAIADANAILANSTSTANVGVRYQNCLQLIRDLAAANQLQNLPAGTLACDPQQGLIVNATTK